MKLEGKILKSILNKEGILVNSFHHQAVKEVGNGLVVAARSSDGVIEALEYENHPYCLSVQWHPKELAIIGDNNSKMIFKSFIEACETNKIEE